MKTRLLKNNILKNIILFLVGGILYYGIEFLVKTFITSGASHWSMFLLGGLCFVIIGLLNEHIAWEESIIVQSIKGAFIITGLEFIFGIIFNLILKQGIWDYSHMPFNIMG